MAGRFAGEISGVKLGEGGVNVVGVENNAPHEPVRGIDLHNAEHLGVERVRTAACTPGTAEREAISSGCNGD